MNLQKAK